MIISSSFFIKISLIHASQTYCGHHFMMYVKSRHYTTHPRLTCPVRQSYLNKTGRKKILLDMKFKSCDCPAPFLVVQASLLQSLAGGLCAVSAPSVQSEGLCSAKTTPHLGLSPSQNPPGSPPGLMGKRGPCKVRK